jgi:hypothetical protein
VADLEPVELKKAPSLKNGGLSWMAEVQEKQQQYQLSGEVPTEAKKVLKDLVETTET